MSEQTNLEPNRYTVRRDGLRNLSFAGDLLAEVSSQEDRRPRWVELRLWKTHVRGTYVCGRAYITCWDGEKDRFEAVQAKTHEEIVQFFEFTDLAKRLYAVAGIDANEEVE